MPSDKRVLIIGADGLRPDLVTLELMPTYARLQQEGTLFSEFYAAYPPHTRVNMTTFTTGVKPGRHGVLANLMFVPGAGEEGLVDTSNDRHLRGFEAQVGEPFVAVPTLGDRLHAQGKRLAVAASSSAGASFLWNPRHPERILNPASHYGDPDLLALHEKLGPVLPEKGRSKLERACWAADALIDVLLDDPDNQVLVLWLSEPDASQHFYGLGSPEALEAQRVVDGCVARVLKALEQKGMADATDVLLVSDHGHSSVAAHRSLGDYLATAHGDLKLTSRFTAVGDFVYAAPGSVPTDADLAALSLWLGEQAWCDVVFSGPLDVPGAIPLEVVQGASSPGRNPLLAVSATWSEEANPFGVPGTVDALTSLAALKSTHGSASPYDLRAFCLAYGPSFKRGFTSALPCGTTDIAPTLSALLGLPKSDSFDGRVLKEGLVGPEAPAVGALRVIHSRRQNLLLLDLGETRYFTGTAERTEKVKV